MSEKGGAVLERAPEGEDSALTALFFVVIALFLGEEYSNTFRPKRVDREVHFCALCRNIHQASLGMDQDSLHCFVACESIAFLSVERSTGRIFREVTCCIGVGCVAGHWQRDIHEKLGLCGPWHCSLGGTAIAAFDLDSQHP